MSSRLTINRSDRRGFGLFSDDEDDSDIERTPVSFSGNKSGFQALSPGDAGNSSPAASTSSMISPLASSTPTRGSRNSALITPQRPRSAHRSTPYSTTTSRALMRAKISKDATIDRESELISAETTYETSTTLVKKSKYTMCGARGNPQEDAEPEPDGREEQEGAKDNKGGQEFSITPSRNIFSRTTTPNKTPTKSPKKESQVPETGKKTWGQWLGAILPASVKKPVKAILGDPAEARSAEQEVRTPRKEAPAQDYDFEDNEGLSLPGSFGKAPPSPVRTPSQPPSKREQRKVEISYETPSREGLLAYQKLKAAAAPRTLPPPSRRIIPTLASSKTPGRSASPAVTPSSSFHRPSNFIERMKSAKRTNRYDPYSRPRGASTHGKKRSPEPSEPKELTAEEELELLKRREKERKVQEAEDRYLKREIRKKLGQEDPEQDGDGDSEMSDTDTSFLQPSVEEVLDEGEPPTGAPPVSPAPRSPARQSAPATPTPTGSPPAFLFGNPSPPSATTAPTPAAPEPATAPTTWSFSSDSDKENISSGPPPPPTMSHAQLPAPLTTSSHPPSIAGGLLGTSPQPAGGFGLGLSKESTPLNRQRNAAEKFKPHISSGLRESSTVDEEKENENDIENKKPFSGYDKENASSSSSGKLGGPSNGGVGGGLAMQSVFKPSGALKENSGVLNLGKSDAKVDLRAKIDAIPHRQLECTISWPSLNQPFGGKDVRAAVESMLNTAAMGEFPEGFDGEMFGLAVHVGV
ncbi:hypothetical protein C7212DRAFT_365236 [Tuber magnatum]|uniref:Uncharacterized protein n=1 Tax=Tuber magnatum TaxID=42249 RepID=A0A317SM69_9PEZI|nr:hypothetical protein C7212DRAFT_365236 [Tuber magnatum]